MEIVRLHFQYLILEFTCIYNILNYIIVNKYMTCDHEVTTNKATKLEGNNNAMSILWRMIDRDKTLNSIHYEYLRILLF